MLHYKVIDDFKNIAFLPKHQLLRELINLNNSNFNRSYVPTNTNELMKFALSEPNESYFVDIN